MIKNTFANIKSKFVWFILLILVPVVVFAQEAPTPIDAPPDFAPPPGPPPPPPLPIDDYIVPMIFIAILIAIFYFFKAAKVQRS